MKIAQIIDHTILKPDATKAEVLRLCKEALEYGFASVCINARHVPLVSGQLQGSGVKTCSVIGFPLGATTTSTKVFEAKEAIANGAGEIDMVIDIGAALDGEYDAVRRDIRSVVEAAGGRALVKVIIEACLLNDDQKVKVCQCAVEAGADFVKTSTGFSTGGATVEDVALMKQAVDGKAKVKASGGVRTLADAMAMVEAGADRIGTSNGVALATSK